jgi:hypothetical protein
MQRDPMPWSFRSALGAFVIFAVGGALIVFAHFQGGWESITYFAYGLLTAGVGLFGALFFSIICAVTRPEWRRQSLIAIALAILLSVALFLVWRVA